MAVKEKIQHPWYSFQKVCSYNAVINMILGARGFGKTYGAKVRAVKKFIKYGEEFIYLRRYKTELETKAMFFTDFKNEFPDWDFRVHGFEAQIASASTRKDEKRVWRTMGYFMALSAGVTKKGGAYENVTTIIFDEFIIEKGVYHYLPNETKALLDFYSTIDRGQDKTTVFMLANSVSIMNPYFLDWEIRPTEDTDLIRIRDGFIVAHFPKSKDFTESIQRTRFGRFNMDSEYEKYALGNNFDDNHAELLEIKDGLSQYQFSIEMKVGKFAVWNNPKKGTFFIQTAIPKVERILVMDANKMGEGKTFTVLSDAPLDYLRRGWRRGRVKFDNPSTRNIFGELFRK